jgi:hypothetical protein
MKKILFYLLLAAFPLILHSFELNMDGSVFTKDLDSKMKTLSAKSHLVDIGRKFICIKTNRFEVSNAYIVPYIYSKIISDSKKIEDYSGDDIDNMFRYFTDEIAEKNIFFYAAVDSNLTAGKSEIDAFIRKNGIIFFDTVFGWKYVYGEIVKSVMIRKYMETFVFGKISVTENEIKDYYEKNPSIGITKRRAVVRDIRMMTRHLDEKQKAGIIKKMISIKDLLEKGADFSALAKTYSDDKGSSFNGGQLGDFLEEGEIPAEIGNIIFELRPGRISGITEYAGAYYIFRLDKIEEEKRRAVGEMKSEIISLLMSEKKNVMFEKEKHRLEKKFNLSIFLNEKK